jgi:RimJ/RimL family protein N-acetyltransferase
MLSGERVVLRPTSPDDYPAMYAWRIDPATWASMNATPLAPVTYADYCETVDRRVRANEGAEFAIDVDGALVGRCGLFNIDALSRHAELGIAFGPEHRGKGYGRDAIRVLLRYAFTHRNLHRVHLETLATNTAGLRAYAAAGFVEEGRLREHAWDGIDKYVDCVLMGILRSEWTP